MQRPEASAGLVWSPVPAGWGPTTLILHVPLVLLDIPLGAQGPCSARSDLRELCRGSCSLQSGGWGSPEGQRHEIKNFTVYIQETFKHSTTALTLTRNNG